MSVICNSVPMNYPSMGWIQLSKHKSSTFQKAKELHETFLSAVTLPSNNISTVYFTTLLKTSERQLPLVTLDNYDLNHSKIKTYQPILLSHRENKADNELPRESTAETLRDQPPLIWGSSTRRGVCIGALWTGLSPHQLTSLSTASREPTTTTAILLSTASSKAAVTRLNPHPSSTSL